MHLCIYRIRYHTKLYLTGTQISTPRIDAFTVFLSNSVIYKEQTRPVESHTTKSQAKRHPPGHTMVPADEEGV